jgi:hypothetical protein
VAPTKQDEHIEDKHEHEDQQYRGHRVLLGEWFVGVHGVRWLLPSDAPPPRCRSARRAGQAKVAVGCQGQCLKYSLSCIIFHEVLLLTWLGRRDAEPTQPASRIQDSEMGVDARRWPT